MPPFSFFKPRPRPRSYQPTNTKAPHLPTPLKIYQDRITHCKSVWNTILIQKLLSRQRDLISETRINHLQWQLHDLEWDITWRQNSQPPQHIQGKFEWMGRLFCFRGGGKEKDPLNEKSLALVKTFDDFLLELKMNLRTEEVEGKMRDVRVQILVPPPVPRPSNSPKRVPSPRLPQVPTPSSAPPSPPPTPPPKDIPARKEIKIVKVLRPERSQESDFLTPRVPPPIPGSPKVKFAGGGGGGSKENLVGKKGKEGNRMGEGKGARQERRISEKKLRSRGSFGSCYFWA